MKKTVVNKHGAFKKKLTEPGKNIKGTDQFAPDIFKLQWPLIASDEPKILVYNQSRSWQGEIAITQELIELFDGRLKVFVIATPQKDGPLIPSAQVSDPGW